MTAAALAVAFVVFSCKGKLSEAEKLNLKETPIQTVDSMYLVQTEDGGIQMRVKAGLMERYDNDTISYELFPKGLEVFAYAEDGVLETYLQSDNAKHYSKKNKNEEKWSAFGHVVVQNIIKQETLETDTLYWDRGRKEIFTDCYVRMFSNDGFMQGYGMRSDEMARDVVIYKPFNSFAVVVQDTTKVIIDSVNFVGPLLKNNG
jgi:LPS export ABC transporter protein LptC